MIEFLVCSRTKRRPPNKSKQPLASAETAFNTRGACSTLQHTATHCNTFSQDRFLNLRDWHPRRAWPTDTNARRSWIDPAASQREHDATRTNFHPQIDPLEPSHLWGRHHRSNRRACKKFRFQVRIESICDMISEVSSLLHSSLHYIRS